MRMKGQKRKIKGWMDRQDGWACGQTEERIDRDACTTG